MQFKVKPLKENQEGSAANTVIAVSQFGGSSFYSCKVANDEYGDFYLKDMNDAGVKTNLDNKERESGVTGKCLVMVTPDADRTMNTFLGATTDISEAEVDEHAIKGTIHLFGRLFNSFRNRYESSQAC